MSGNEAGGPGSMDIDLQAIVESFVAESGEGLSAAEKSLVTLESNPEDAEALGTVFRVAHTVKGSAGSLGFPRMAEFAHVMEDVLDGLRKKTVGLTSPLTSLLLHSVDALRTMVPEAVGGGEEMRPEHRALMFRGLPGVAGSAILGNGRVALILDVPTLLREVSMEKGLVA